MFQQALIRNRNSDNNISNVKLLEIKRKDKNRTVGFEIKPT